MSEIPHNSPERNELLDDNARKFVVQGIDDTFLESYTPSSFTLTVDWLETDEAKEKKLAYKEFDDGKVEILLISKHTLPNGKRKTTKPQITNEKYLELLQSSILHLEKRRHEFVHIQGGIPFSMKLDEFAGGELKVIEVDASTDEERAAFKPSSFPANLREVTGDVNYYGYRVAGIVHPPNSDI